MATAAQTFLAIVLPCEQVQHSVLYPNGDPAWEYPNFGRKVGHWYTGLVLSSNFTFQLLPKTFLYLEDKMHAMHSPPNKSRVPKDVEDGFTPA